VASIFSLIIGYDFNTESGPFFFNHYLASPRIAQLLRLGLEIVVSTVSVKFFASGEGL